MTDYKGRPAFIRLDDTGIKVDEFRRAHQRRIHQVFGSMCLAAFGALFSAATSVYNLYHHSPLALITIQTTFVCACVTINAFARWQELRKE